MAPSWPAAPLRRASRTLPQIEKILAEAAAADAAGDAADGGSPQPATPRTLARRRAPAVRTSGA
jgi:hypothetical protein